MSGLREAAQQALEALYQAREFTELYDTEHAAAVNERCHENIAALRAALAQQAEPDLSRCPQCNGTADNGFDRSFPPSPYLCTKCMAEPVQPGAWVASKDGRVIYDYVSTDDCLLRVSGDFENDEQRLRYAQRIVDALNAAPPQRTMVPLTEDEIYHTTGHCGVSRYTAINIARAVEKASWEKNHGQA